MIWSNNPNGIFNWQISVLYGKKPVFGSIMAYGDLYKIRQTDKLKSPPNKLRIW